MKKTLRKEIELIIQKEDVNSDILKDFEKILRDNSSSSLKQFYNYFFLFIGFAFSWILVKGASIEKIKLLGVEISNVEIILMVIPVITAVIFYRCVSLILMHSLIEDMLFEVYDKYFKEFKDSDCLYFLTPPSFLIFESFIGTRINNKILSFVNSLWTLILASVIILTPIILIIWMIIDLINFNQLSHLISAIISGLLLTRIIVMLIIGFKELMD